MAAEDTERLDAGGPEAGWEGAGASDRVAQLEARVDGLAQALLALAAGLECEPGQGTDGERAAHGARLARELLLSLGLPAPSTPGAGGRDEPAP